MKKFTAALLAAALTLPGLAAPAMAEQQHKSQPQQSQNHGQQVSKVAKTQSYKTFRKGDRFDSRYARNYRQIDYRKYKKLKAPPKGYRYVQSGSDILLIGTTSGIVASVLTGMIR